MNLWLLNSKETKPIVQKLAFLLAEKVHHLKSMKAVKQEYNDFILKPSLTLKNTVRNLKDTLLQTAELFAYEL